MIYRNPVESCIGSVRRCLRQRYSLVGSSRSSSDLIVLLVLTRHSIARSKPKLISERLCSFVTSFKGSYVMIDLIGRVSWRCITPDLGLKPPPPPLGSIAIKEFFFQPLHKL